MDKIFKSLNSINSFSKNIIFYGCMVVIAFCLLGVGLICYNNAVAQEVALYELGSAFIKNSTVIFAQVIIGSLVIDLFHTMMQNNS